MTNVIPMHDTHQQAIELLPWYASGSLDEADARTVETHLMDCAECRRELDRERAMARLVAELQVEVERGWTAMRDRVERPALPDPRPARPRWPARAGGGRAGVPWALAAPAAAASLLIGMFVGLPSAREEGPYRALGSATAAPAGNAVLLFKSDAREHEIRSALDQTGARLVDGPTASGAYVVRIPAEVRAGALERLRRLDQVVLAEPLDAAEALE